LGKRITKSGINPFFHEKSLMSKDETKKKVLRRTEIYHSSRQKDFMCGIKDMFG